MTHGTPHATPPTPLADPTVLNVRDFGATGDGKTDDTRAIQRALDAAGERKASVFFPDGTYNCSTLRTHDHVGLVAHPLWDYYNRRNGAPSGGARLNLIDPDATCLLDLARCRGVRVTGLSLLGNRLGTNVHGIASLKDRKRKSEEFPAIERTMITGFTGDGIHLQEIWCFSLRGCAIGLNGGNGLYMHGGDGYILDNWFSGNGSAGIRSDFGSGSMHVTANRIEWNQQGGLVVARAWTWTITGNYLDRNAGPGLHLKRYQNSGHGCFHFVVTGNLINRSGRAQWTEPDSDLDCNVRLDGCRGLNFTGNGMTCGADDDGRGRRTPSVALRLRDLDDSIVASNTMHHGATRALIEDEGGHGDNFVLRDNIGSLRND